MVLRVSSAILLFILLFGCQSRDVVPKLTGKEYVPVFLGAYWEYSLTEMTISPVNGQVNNLMDLRVEVSQAYNSGNELIYVLRRSTRPQGTTTYTAAETWSVRADDFQWVQQEGNISFVKLQFPLAEGKSWNGNALNNQGGTEACGDGTFGCDNYSVNSLRKPFEIPGVLSYDNSVTIIENNEDDPIVSKDVRKSVYAYGIGLVYREVTQLEYCTVGDCIGQQVIESGLITRQTLKSYGVAQ